MTKAGSMKVASGMVAALGAFASVLAFASKPQVTRDYNSIDGMARASVIVMKTGESEVRIYGVTGTLLIERNFASADGAHGLVIQRATWSPDSGYFVFSGMSSGGHQPWHAPTFIYSRATNGLYELDTCVAGIAVVAPDFDILSPHLVRVTVGATSEDQGLAEQSRRETYDLAKVVQKCRST
jgi:hypothetical protein